MSSIKSEESMHQALNSKSRFAFLKQVTCIAAVAFRGVKTNADAGSNCQPVGNKPGHIWVDTDRKTITITVINRRGV